MSLISLNTTQLSLKSLRFSKNMKEYRKNLNKELLSKRRFNFRKRKYKDI